MTEEKKTEPRKARPRGQSGADVFWATAGTGILLAGLGGMCLMLAYALRVMFP